MPESKLTDTFAAVDLGSNSFHMKIVRVVQDEVQDVDRLRERVRLAAGLRETRPERGGLAKAFDTLRGSAKDSAHPAKQVRRWAPTPSGR
jgi:exopolyphosphatase/guanosine-5'-triphosphate,3'-diphosphate pyrophosphatase